MRSVRPLTVFRSGIDRESMLVDAIAVVCRADEIGIVAIAVARMMGNAVQNGGAVHEVLDVPLQFVQSRVDGHGSPVSGDLRSARRVHQAVAPLR